MLLLFFLFSLSHSEWCSCLCVFICVSRYLSILSRLLPLSVCLLIALAKTLAYNLTISQSLSAFLPSLFHGIDIWTRCLRRILIFFCFKVWIFKMHRIKFNDFEESVTEIPNVVLLLEIWKSRNFDTIYGACKSSPILAAIQLKMKTTAHVFQ